jgi:hypothetical protein
MVVKMIAHLHPMNCMHHTPYNQDSSLVTSVSYITDGVHGPKEIQVK